MKVLREREKEIYLDEFWLVECYMFLQRFFEAYILSLSLMTIGDLQLAVVKEI